MSRGAVTWLTAALVVTVACSCSDDDRPASGLEAGGFPDDYPRPEYDTAVVKVGGHEVTVEVADTAVKRRYGCMFLSELGDDRGMIFVYPKARFMSFWMRNTRIPLDILYLTDDGRIVNAHRDMLPLRDEPSYPSAPHQPVRFALELPGGWMDRHGVWLTHKVELPDELLSLEAEEDDVLLGNIPPLIGPDADR